MIKPPANYYQHSYFVSLVAGPPRVCSDDLWPLAVSRMKNRCKVVSSVIQCTANRGALPKFRQCSPPVRRYREAPLQAFSAGTGFGGE